MSEIIRIPTPGDLIGEQFELARELGRGGYGVVFEAIQHGIDRKVAVKMLLPRALESQAKIVERFKREAKLASTLTHPSAVVIYAFGVHKGQQDEVELPYLAMEYLDGENVQEYMLRTGPLPPEQTQYILEQALGSLHEAHRKGIVHRDMKPDNLFLHQPAGEEMVVKVLDYGIAVACTPEWSQQERERLTKTGMVTGTAEYIAPEMVSGQGPVSPSVDVYSVGCVAYHMLTGTFPYQGNNPVEIAIKHLYEPTAELPAPFAASFLGQVVHRAMSKQPAQRYRDAGHMLKALRTGELWPEPDDASSRLSSERQIIVPSAVRPSAAQAVVPSEPSTAGATGVQAAPGTQATLVPEPPAPPKGKGLWLASAALALIVALGALGWAWSQRDQPSEQAPAASAAPPIAQDPPPAAQEAQVDLTSEPSAEVYAGERRLGQTPLTLRASELREPERGLALELRAAGHQPQTLSIDWANPKPSYAARLSPSEPTPSEPTPSEPTPAELPNDAQAAGKPAPKPPTPKEAAPAGGDEPPQGGALGAALEPQANPTPQGEPPKEAPATAEPSKIEPPKVEPPKTEPPKVEPPKPAEKPAEKPKEEPAVPHSF